MTMNMIPLLTASHTAADQRWHSLMKWNCPFHPCSSHLVLWTVVSGLKEYVDVEDACEWSYQCFWNFFKTAQVNRHPERSRSSHETNLLQRMHQAAPFTVRLHYLMSMTVVGLYFHPKSISLSRVSVGGFKYGFEYHLGIYGSIIL